MSNTSSSDRAPLPLVVWYNTYCPVCRTGIDRQRNRLLRAVKAGAIEFRDINLEPDALASLGIEIEAVRRRLHGTDSLGRVYVGIDCAIEIWRRTPGETWIARLLETHAIHKLAEWTYDRFASRLYAWNRRKGHW
jgi:predicted DCC family thiol-disulfide oxidoreductase YuxK